MDCNKKRKETDKFEIKNTDNSGSANYNAQLSLQRAETLANELKKRVISDDIRYDVKGLGERQPIASNQTQDGKLENRRVVLEIIFKEN